jgi:hypothetical protein
MVLLHRLEEELVVAAVAGSWTASLKNKMVGLLVQAAVASFPAVVV